MKKNLIQIGLLALVIFLSIMLYLSIMEPVHYKKATDSREQVIIEKLNHIKELQVQYKVLNGAYTGSFDRLKDFYSNDEMPQVLKSGIVPDSLTEEQALEMGIITRDTSYVPIKDVVLKDVENFDINTIDIVPFTHGEIKFEMDSSMVKKANFEVPVFEVRCFKKDYLAEIKEQELLLNDLKLMEEDEKFPGLKLGSLTEPSTDGNW